MSATTTIIFNAVMVIVVLGGLAAAMWTPFGIARSERTRVKRSELRRPAAQQRFEPVRRAA